MQQTRWYAVARMSYPDLSVGFALTTVNASPLLSIVPTCWLGKLRLLAVHQSISQLRLAVLFGMLHPVTSLHTQTHARAH